MKINDKVVIVTGSPSGIGKATADDVASQIQRKSRLSPDLIKYIAKTKITA